MRTLLAGLEAFKRKPLAIAPVSAENVLVAGAIAFGLLPARGTVAAAGAAFPLDVYFDLKHALAVTSSWPVFLLAVVASVCVRALVLTLTFVLAEEDSPVNLRVWVDAVRTASIAVVMFFPVAGLIFAGTAIRYAPFLWLAAPVGLGIAISRARRGVNLDVGSGSPRGDAMPEAAPFLGYAGLVAVAGASISSIGRISPLLAAAFVVLVGPLHALVLLGWRQNARAEVYPGGGVIALTATVVIAGMLASATFFDRVVRNPGPIAETQREGTLALLGGSDSTHRSGAITEIDVRSLGYPEARVRLLSYSSGSSYSARETHGDLDAIADRVAAQLATSNSTEAIVGHSQAALILDRMLEQGADVPPRSVMLAPPPPWRTTLGLPPAGLTRDGKPGGDVARAISAILQAAGRPGFDIDAPASPNDLDTVVVPDADVARLSVWALADSVWLDRDWRRPGELNLIAITDHVGVTQNERVLDSARSFLAGSPVTSDVGSWRAILVPVIRYAFEPWRPENR